ncbi:MAG: metallophosphoesterase family protein [Candidatus Glassbacteria bacterium]
MKAKENKNMVWATAILVFISHPFVVSIQSVTSGTLGIGDSGSYQIESAENRYQSFGSSNVFAVQESLIYYGPYIVTIEQNSDDGTEVNEADWYESGYTEDHKNIIGLNEDIESYGAGFRFHVDKLSQGNNIVFARLRFASKGGIVQSSANLLIEGVAQISPTTFSETERPSRKLPKTRTGVDWEISDSWPNGASADPLYCYSPDIAPILNEILELPNWGNGDEGKTIIITAKDFGSDSSDINAVFFEDFYTEGEVNNPVALEIYRTVYDTFLGKELLGRVTDTSATVNLYSLIDTDVYIKYGTSPGMYTETTEHHLDNPAENAIEIIIDDLLPDTRYYYRLMFRGLGEPDYKTGIERTFHTQRPSGSQFTFSVITDEHVDGIYRRPENIDDISLHNLTLKNVGQSNPDFLISMGDTGYGYEPRTPAPYEYFPPESDYIFQFGLERALRIRKHLDLIAHSIPQYFVLGNHEGEQGWFYDPTDEESIANSSAGINTRVRKELVPNPYPDSFYTGSTDSVPGIGLRENYYAWEWGDALFVTLDPFWYTTSKPHNWHGPGTEDSWDWTLGEEQYNWLYDTLHNSDAKWKFVFTHHLTGGTTPYGRGGIEAVKYKVDDRASYEWGGEDEGGNCIFDEKRPGWSHGPIHDFLVSEGVDIVFHGHDHFFAFQELDGIVYLECPKTSDSDYEIEHQEGGFYSHGDFLPSSGHINVTVGKYFVKLDYIRSYLPGDGKNGEVAFTRIIKDHPTRAIPVQM